MEYMALISTQMLMYWKTKGKILNENAIMTVWNAIVER